MTLKKRLFSIPAGIILALTIAAAAHAQGTTSALFLEEGVGARAQAMGDAYVALSDDANGINVNPAGMTQMKGRMASVMHNETVFDMTQDNVAYVQGSGDSALGASLLYRDFGSFQRRSVTDVPDGYFTARSWALTGGYAQNFDNDALAWGANLKYIKEDIDTASDASFALDLGLLYKPEGETYSLGLAVRNIGGALKLGTNKDPLALAIRAGGAYRSAIMPLTVAAEIVKIKDLDAEFHLGAEYVLMEIIAFRLGYNSNDDLDNPITAGVGFKQRNYEIDYAFVPLGVFGDSHRLSYSMRF